MLDTWKETNQNKHEMNPYLNVILKYTNVKTIKIITFLSLFINILWNYHPQKMCCNSVHIINPFLNDAGYLKIQQNKIYMRHHYLNITLNIKKYEKYNKHYHSLCSLTFSKKIWSLTHSKLQNPVHKSTFKNIINMCINQLLKIS